MILHPLPGEQESPPSSRRIVAPPRELAYRRSGTEEIFLLWYPDSDRVEVCIRDTTNGVVFEIDVAPDRALDAFHHPYAHAYTARAIAHANRAADAESTRERCADARACP